MACFKINISPPIQQNTILLQLISWEKAMEFLEFVKVFSKKLLTLEVGDIRPPLRIEVKLDLGILPLMTLRLPKSSTASVFTKFRPPLIWRKNSQLQEVKFEQSLFWFSQGVDFRFKFTGTNMIKITQPSCSSFTFFCDKTTRWLSVSWFYIGGKKVG